jgi:hypothetical protein
LASGYFLEYSVPVLEGSFRTKLRIVLKTERNGGHDFISNEFEGSVNAGQFWNPQMRSNTSILELYGDY